MIERVLSWAFAITAAVLLLFVVYEQLLGPTPNPVFGLVAVRSGIAFFEPWGRYATALAELVAIGLVLWPRTRARGAMLALAITVVAIAMHLSPWLGIAVPRADEVASVAGRGWSDAEIFAMGLPTDQGAMFLLALFIAGLSGAIIAVERAVAYAGSHKVKRPTGAYA
jgi:hypothetical protein